jgi:hypothetical protein
MLMNLCGGLMAYAARLELSDDAALDPSLVRIG